MYYVVWVSFSLSLSVWMSPDNFKSKALIEFVCWLVIKGYISSKEKKKHRHRHPFHLIVCMFGVISYHSHRCRASKYNRTATAAAVTLVKFSSSFSNHDMFAFGKDVYQHCGSRDPNISSALGGFYFLFRSFLSVARPRISYLNTFNSKKKISWSHFFHLQILKTETQKMAKKKCPRQRIHARHIFVAVLWSFISFINQIIYYWSIENYENYTNE